VHPTRAVKIALAALVAMAMLAPALVIAQEREHAGVVLLARADATAAEPLPFRRQMVLTERINARAGLFARLLFGGRVMVLAREGACLRITEVSGAAAIEVENGRVAITVDRENLHPEDLVEVRTPHAVVSVPGDTLVVDVGAASVFAPVGRPVEVFRVDPVSGKALEPPTVAGADALVTVETPPISVANR
jgi:hypothetical protein